MTTKPKPDAEVVGLFAEVLKRGKCDDGRDYYEFDWLNPDADFNTYVLAKSKLEAWKALRSEIGTLERLTKAKLQERTTQFALKLMEAQNGET